MAKIVYLVEDDNYKSLYPLNVMRHTGNIQVGYLTIKRRWEYSMGLPVYFFEFDRNVLPEERTLALPPVNESLEYIFINSQVLPNSQLVDVLQKGRDFSLYHKKYGWVASSSTKNITSKDKIKELPIIEIDFPLFFIRYPWEIIAHLESLIYEDIKIILEDEYRRFKDSPKKNLEEISQNVFVHKSAKIANSAELNGSIGPIIILDDAEVMEGSYIRGPVIIGPKSVVKMGSKIYGPLAVGRFNKIGGEINHSIIYNYSNKAHDGFLGHSIIGSWCNLGANTTTSNLKNTYGTIKAYSYIQNSFIDTGLQFLGTIMGDCVRTGICCMFNSGTVIGGASCLWGSNFFPKHIPLFSWGEPHKLTNYSFDNFYTHLLRMMERRHIDEYKNMKEKMKNALILWEIKKV